MSFAFRYRLEEVRTLQLEAFAVPPVLLESTRAFI